MNNRTVFVTGADRGLGLALCAELAGGGWRVFAGQFLPDWPELNELAARYPERVTPVALDAGSPGSVRQAAEAVAAQTDRLDMLINNAGVSSPKKDLHIRDLSDFDDLHRLYDINALGPLRVVQAFLPLMEAGEMRRLCFVSSEAGSVERSTRTSWYGYCMSKSALNMGVKILFNDLRPEGFTFRIIHPGWVRSYLNGAKMVEAELEPEEAARLALVNFLSGLEPGGAPYDEDRLVLRDEKGLDWPW